MDDTQPVLNSWYKLRVGVGEGPDALPKGAKCQVIHVEGTTVMRFLDRWGPDGRLYERRFSVDMEAFGRVFARCARPIADLKAWSTDQKNRTGGA